MRRSLAALAAAAVFAPSLAFAATNDQLIALYTQLIAILEQRIALLAAAGAATSSDADAPLAGNVLEVSDPGQPDSSLAPQNASPLFLAFTLATGDAEVTIRSITFAKSGLGDDGAFYSFGLYDPDGLEIGSDAGLDATHHITFRKQFTIPPHTRMEIDLYGNMQADLSAYDAQRPAFSLVAVDASVPVSGTLPLVGTPHTINTTISVGSAGMTLSPYDPMADTQRLINDHAVRFSGVRFSADAQEDLGLAGIIWTQAGSAGPGDLANVETVVNGVAYPTTISPYDARQYVTIIDPEIVIPKGQTIDAYIQADTLPGAANRTVQFNIQHGGDVSLEGKTYSLAVGAYPAGNTSTSDHSSFLTTDGTTDGDSLTPFFQGSVATVNSVMVNYIGR